jgi:hypothetical protein
MLKTFPDLKQEDRQSLTALRKVATAIDLNNPSDPEWKLSCQITINDKPVDVMVSLQKVDPLSRLGTMLLSEDVPKEQRANKYSFKVQFTPAEPTQTNALRNLKQRMNQLGSAVLVASPMAAVTWASATFLPAKVVPEFTTNSTLQSMAENSADLAPIVLTGIASYFALRHLKELRFR